MLFDILRRARSLQASDVHITAEAVPMVRVQGRLQPLNDESVPQKKLLQEIDLLLPAAVRAQLDRTGAGDWAFTDGQGERCRGNIYRYNGSYALAIRLLSSSVPDCAALHIPQAVCSLTDKPQGLLLITGPTGSGKTTTLAALINRLNTSRPVHIITLEDPVEYKHQPQKALIHQREVGTDTKSFASGLRSALREDPDVILVGELRDGETMAIALTAAETGHLVLATLHTRDAVSSINRILDMLPQNQQQIRSQLADCLLGVVSQRLLPRKEGKGRIAAWEILLMTPAVSNLIREGRVHQLPSYLQTGGRYGMITMEESLRQLQSEGYI